MHIKAMVVDEAVAIIMNQNITRSAFTSNREFGVVTTHHDAVQTMMALFEADWTRGAEPDPGPLVVSPTNARQELLSLVREAGTSLDQNREVGIIVEDAVNLARLPRTFAIDFRSATAQEAP